MIDGYLDSACPKGGRGTYVQPTNLHAVEPHPGGRRIVFAFFPGAAAVRRPHLTSTGRLVHWS
ncbi:hypothetical protein HEK616_33460 [Streptomyces nigrescens]|uniref:Uncharacterized protein n=1 Tax=Streptomyces nigrescens TaxID=1920 RepID=A0ABN6QZR6_STRNI|nr:hypothetical protein HEK616_33460 [Streptomyces nigrescens]